MITRIYMGIGMISYCIIKHVCGILFTRKPVQ